MLHKSEIKMGSNRSFGLVFFLVFLIISLWNFRGDINEIRFVPFYFSLFFLFLGILNSKFLTPLNKLWFKFGLFLGAIVAPIVMGIVFFLVVTPIGIIIRILGKDLVNKKYDKNKKTYWIKYNKTSDTMKRQF